MLDGWNVSQFEQLSQGMQSVASNTDVAQSLFFVTPVTSFIVTVMSYLGAVMIFLLPAMWLAQALIKSVPFVGSLVSGGNGGGAGMGAGGMVGGGGKSDSAFAGIGKLVIEIALAAITVTGAWITIVTWETNTLSVVAQKITSSNLFNGSDTPQSIKQYKGLVDTYDNSEAAEQYQMLFSKEESMAERLVTYYKNNSPADSDSSWLKMKSQYTSIVAKLQVLSNKLQSSGYAKQSGSSDPNIFKRHLNQTKASDEVTAPYKPSFISPSMAQAYGVELGTSSN